MYSVLSYQKCNCSALHLWSCEFQCIIKFPETNISYTYITYGDINRCLVNFHRVPSSNLFVFLLFFSILKLLLKILKTNYQNACKLQGNRCIKIRRTQNDRADLTILVHVQNLCCDSKIGSFIIMLVYNLQFLN